jgi:DNA-binding NtrC family response regulator
MNAILIADEETRICSVIREFFQSSQGLLACCAHTGPEATRLLEQEHYDLALIGLPLVGTSGFDLAAIAVEKNTAVLLMTGHPVLQLTMRQFGFPYLGKPFTLNALRIAAERAVLDHPAQSAQLRTALKHLTENRKAMAKAMDESDRLLDVDRARQQLDHWDSAVARVKDALHNNDISQS